MIIIVKHGDKSTTVSVDGADTLVSKVKEILEERLGVPVARQRLAFAGARMRDSRSLARYGVRPESTIHLFEAAAPAPAPAARASKSKRATASPTPAATAATATTTTTTTTTTAATAVMDMSEVMGATAGMDMTRGMDIVFAFDTTGSMASYLQAVRKQIVDLIERLHSDIGDIRIGVMAVGDYCDHQNYVVETVDLTYDTARLVDFVNSVRRTTGGDTPEAYEWALHEAQSDKLAWDPDRSHAFVLVADAYPHPPSYTNLDIFWVEELRRMVQELDMRVYAVQAGNCKESSAFFGALASMSGGFHIRIADFDVMAAVFLGCCYREASREAFDAFRGEMMAAERSPQQRKALEAVFDKMVQPLERTVAKRDAFSESDDDDDDDEEEEEEEGKGKGKGVASDEDSCASSSSSSSSSTSSSSSSVSCSSVSCSASGVSHRAREGAREGEREADFDPTKHTYPWWNGEAAGRAMYEYDEETGWRNASGGGGFTGKARASTFGGAVVRTTRDPSGRYLVLAVDPEHHFSDASDIACVLAGALAGAKKPGAAGEVVSASTDRGVWEGVGLSVTKDSEGAPWRAAFCERATIRLQVVLLFPDTSLVAVDLMETLVAEMELLGLMLPDLVVVAAPTALSSYPQKVCAARKRVADPIHAALVTWSGEGGDCDAINDIQLALCGASLATQPGKGGRCLIM